jgi:hypothetical protein
MLKIATMAKLILQQRIHQLQTNDSTGHAYQQPESE